MNKLLGVLSTSLNIMTSLLMGELGTGGAAHMLHKLPDLAAIDANSPPRSWLQSCPSGWTSSSLRSAYALPTERCLRCRKAT